MGTPTLYLASALLFIGLGSPSLAGPSSVGSVTTVAPCCRGAHSGGGGRSASRSRAAPSRTHSYGTRTYAPRASSSHTTRVRSYHSPVYRAPSATRVRTYSGPRSPRVHAPGERDRRGRLERSSSAKSAFERQTGHARGWQGHVVDHIVPLACGGSDAPSNMQWQTAAEAKAKDRVERRGCGNARHH